MVGDPMQVEPVVELPDTLTASICAELGVDAAKSAAPSASAQIFADRASPFIGGFETKGGTRSVGIPLLVHRRCAQPMFGVSNAVAYENLMVSAKAPLGSPIGLALGESRWIHVAGRADGHWCPEEGQELLRLLRELAQKRIPPNLYVVTPFRAVAREARDLIQSSRVLDGLERDVYAFTQERVGTVHTVQGREAEAVIFILGSTGPQQQGARMWAGRTPNLVNVAVTRAKERLYVIGNRRLWSEAGHFRELDRRLPRSE